MFDGESTRHTARGRLCAVLALAGALLPALVFGQPFVAGNYVLSSGGVSSDSQYSVGGAIGQQDTAASPLVGGTFVEIGGFWNPGVDTTGPSLGGGASSPVLTWSNPPSIFYGTALDTNQLNAMANVAGDFAYTPTAGIVLNAGTNILSVVFTPSNTVSYTSASNTVTLVVLPAALTVTATDAIRLVGTTNPVFTDVITGLTNGDNITVSNACSATSNSPVGMYSIVPSLVDPDSRQTNYDITLNDGVLTIATNLPEAGAFNPIITNRTPVVAITSPIKNYLTTNTSITVVGTVTGSGAKLPLIVANGNAPTNATLVSSKKGTINWSFHLPLLPGANTIIAQTISTNGTETNASYPVTRTYFYDVTLASVKKTSRLTLLTNGLGKITGEANRALLEIGKVFPVTATPAAKWLFAYWSYGTNATNLGFLSTNAALAFDMTSNLVLQANFTNNPFTNVAGVYNGLFYPSTGVTEASSGFFSATLPAAGTGAYTAKVALGGGTYPFSGSFDLSGNAQATLIAANKTPLTVYLHLDLYPPDDQMSGYVFDSTSNGWTSELLADLAVFNGKSVRATNFAGSYTMVFPPGDTAPTNEPGGYGYATITNTLAGTVSISGALGDKSAISQSVTVSKDGVIPLYSSLYSSHGLVLGWLTLTNAAGGHPAQNIVGSNLVWIKTNLAKTLYPGGFTNTNQAVMGYYYTNNFTFTNGTLTLADGNLRAPLVYSNLSIHKGKLITNGFPTNKLTGILTPATGVLTLTFRPTGAKIDTTAKGVVLTETNGTTNAAGWFLGTNQSGSFLLQP